MIVDSVEITAIWRNLFNPFWLYFSCYSQVHLRRLHHFIEDDVTGLLVEAVLHLTSHGGPVAIRAWESVDICLITTQHTRRMNHCPLRSREHYVAIVTLLQFSDVVKETGNETLANLFVHRSLVADIHIEAELIKDEKRNNENTWECQKLSDEDVRENGLKL